MLAQKNAIVAAKPTAGATRPTPPAGIPPKSPIESREPPMPGSIALVEALAADLTVVWPEPQPHVLQAFLEANPGIALQMSETLLSLAAGELQWREAIGFGDWDLIEMANMLGSLISQGRFQQAEEGFGTLCDLSPTTPLLWLEYADIFEAQRKLQDAVQALSFSIQLAEQMDPPLLEALVARLHRGAIQFHAAMGLEAAQDFLAILRSDPEPLGERTTMAAMGLQAIINEGPIRLPDLGLAEGSELGNGWRFLGTQLQHGSAASQASRGGLGLGGRMFTSSQLNASVNFNPGMFRAEQGNALRVSVKFANIARPYFKRELMQAQMSGVLPSANAPQPTPEREALIAALKKRPYAEVRGVYHLLRKRLIDEGKLAQEAAQELWMRAGRMYNALRHFHRHRALAAQIDRYRNAHSTQEIRATRVRAGS